MGNEDTTPLNGDANAIVQEAFEMSDNEAVSIMEEGLNMQTLAQTFEHYVQQYQASWQTDWANGIEAFENEVKDWQETVLKDFFQSAQPPANQAAPKSSTTPSPASKPKK